MRHAGLTVDRWATIYQSLFTFQSLASVTQRCAKQKDRAKIFHCFKFEKKASSRSAPPCLSGCQANTVLIRRCPDNVQNIVPNSNGVQNKFPIMIWMLSAKCEELHAGNVQSMLRAGPTTDRRSRRYATFILCKSFQYTVRCPAAKRAMGEMTRSKYWTV